MKLTLGKKIKLHVLNALHNIIFKDDERIQERKGK